MTTERTAYLSGTVSVHLGAAAAGSDGPKLPRFQVLAYTGGVLAQPWAPNGVVVDLSTMTVAGDPLPVLYGHDLAKPLGHAENVEITAGELSASGVFSVPSDETTRVVQAAGNGYVWQASIGGRPGRVEHVRAGASVQVNGQTYQGPVMVARNLELRHIGLVSNGADHNTRANIAAQNHGGTPMDRIDDQANADVQTAQATPDTSTSVAAAAGAEPTPAQPATKGTRQILAEAKAEANRLQACQDILATYLTSRPDHADQAGELIASAETQGWEPGKLRDQLQLLSASDPGISTVHESRRNGGDAEVLEAAAALSSGLADPEKHYSEQALEAADKLAGGAIGIQELLLRASAERGHRFGMRVTDGNMRDVLAAFSTTSMPGILSNVANKHAKAAFGQQEDAWDRISGKRNVRDFKVHTGYRLTGDDEFQPIAPGGEVKHGTLGERSYTNQAETHGRLFMLTREDIINDDLGVLAQIPARLGSGTAKAINRVFWAEWLDDATFHSTANGNLTESTALTVDGLDAAFTKFHDMKDYDGNPMGLSPRILLVGNALFKTANALMADSQILENGNSSRKQYSTNNPFAGEFTLVRSSHVPAGTFYLMANPSEQAAIEVAFLNGRRTPMIEQASADLNRLGVIMRGIFDFGVAKQEHKVSQKVTA